MTGFDRIRWYQTVISNIDILTTSARTYPHQEIRTGEGLSYLIDCLAKRDLTDPAQALTRQTPFTAGLCLV